MTPLHPTTAANLCRYYTTNATNVYHWNAFQTFVEVRRVASRRCRVRFRISHRARRRLTPLPSLSVVQLNPEYEVLLMLDKHCRVFIRKHFPAHVLTAYDALVPKVTTPHAPKPLTSRSIQPPI